MGAFTAFLNLYKPGGGSTGNITPDEVADIDKLNLNFDTIDDFASGMSSKILIGRDKGSTVLANGTWTALNTATGDGSNDRNDGFTYGAGDINVPVPGIYQVSMVVSFGGSSAGSVRLMRAFSDGTDVLFAQNWRRFATGSLAGNAQLLTMSGIARVTDRIVIQAYQDTGGSLTANLVNIQMSRIAAL